MDLDPKDEDAKFNLEFVRKEIRRRMQESQNREKKPSSQNQQGQQNKQDESKEASGKDDSQKKEASAAQNGSGKDKKEGDKGAESQGVRPMTDEEAKQWLSTLKEGDRSKYQKGNIAGQRQYEVEKDW